MRNSLARTTTAAVLASSVLALGVTSASAENWRAADPTGDVESYSFTPEPAPCGTFTQAVDPANDTADLVSLAVRHRRDTVELSAAFRDFTGGGPQSVEFDVKTNERKFVVTLDRRRTGARTRVWVMRSGEPSAPDECGFYSVLSVGGQCTGIEADISPARDVVSVVLPRQCLRDPRWIRVGVQTTRWAGQSASTDVWADPGTDTAVFDGPYGPRIRRG